MASHPESPPACSETEDPMSARLMQQDPYLETCVAENHELRELLESPTAYPKRKYLGLTILTLLIGVLIISVFVSVARYSKLVLSVPAAGIKASLSTDYYYTHFHAQPLKNWLNDPNGPMYFNGKYHLFFQYNPDNYVWGNMHWYHLVSEDLLHWKHLPIALAPDDTHECGGIWSGSATIFHNISTGQDIPVLTYSVACSQFGESAYPPVLMNAVPTEISDPKLVKWTKPKYNPIIERPANLVGGFRDPTSAWQGKDKVWRMLVGCSAGACQVKSKDFIHWYNVGTFHATRATAFWDCPDFYNIPGSDIYVLKGRFGTMNDFWALGKYQESSDPTKADGFVLSSGDLFQSNQKYDYGVFDASKTFYDPKGKRAILFGWVDYHCSGTDWAGVLSFPRTVELDPSWSSLVMNPIEEIKSLYVKSDVQSNVPINAGSTYVLPYGGTQLDVEVAFAGNFSQINSFGIRVLTSAAAPTSGKALTIVTSGPGTAALEGHPFQVKTNNALTLRVLVDHSIVEGFADHGRVVVTYPYCPLANAREIVIFNAGSQHISANITVHQVKTANVIR